MRRGFTLIEVLICVVILGIGAAMAAPYIGSRDDSKASVAARTLSADLLYAQNLAISTSAKIYVSFDSTNSQYSVLTALPSTYATNPVTKSNYTVATASPASINSANFDSQTTLAFDEMGAPYSVNNGVLTALQSGSVVIASGDYRLTVNVLPVTGQITIQ